MGHRSSRIEKSEDEEAVSPQSTAIHIAWERMMTLFLKTVDGGLVNVAQVVSVIPDAKGTRLTMAKGPDMFCPLSVADIERGHSQIYVVSK